jgi:DNA-binding transcriptional ArsR family regulator
MMVVMGATLQSLHTFVNVKDLLMKGLRLSRDGPRAVDDDGVLRIVERFALLLTESGMPRMPARVFAYALAHDADGHTAGELAAGLRVSPAAISGAVRYLQQTGLLIREREPGARADHYRLRDDLWYELWAARLAQLERWEEVLAEGADLLGPDRPGGARLRDSMEFFAFVRADLPAMMERWHEHQRAGAAGTVGRRKPG